MRFGSVSVSVSVSVAVSVSVSDLVSVSVSVSPAARSRQRNSTRPRGPGIANCILFLEDTKPNTFKYDTLFYKVVLQCIRFCILIRIEYS